MYDEMPKRVIDSSISAHARTRMLDFLQKTASNTEGAVLCLMKDVQGVWVYALYGKGNVDALEPKLRELGHTLFYEIDGILFVIPQFNFLDELIGVIIEEESSGLVLNSKA